MKELDSYDIAILSILQKDNLTPQREIGETVNLSAAAVQRRIKRMSENGIIQSNIAVLDHKHLGEPITIFVELEMEQDKIEMVDELKKKFSLRPEVQQCYYVTGDVDFILVIIVQSMSQYEKLTRSIFFGDSTIKRFRTFIVLDRVKVGLQLPFPGN
jgi:Lrp/AsnC family leucine-responsive transcriptional regulator